jgi:hypothetical protein
LDKAEGGIANPHAEVTIHGAFRLPLKHFAARQTKKGVTYTMQGKRKLVASAFIVDSIGGHVFARHGAKIAMSKGRYIGKMKQPIKKLYGPSPLVAALKNKIRRPLQKEANAELRKQIERRIRFIKLKNSGAI